MSHSGTSEPRNETERVLFVLVGRVGDMVMVTPALRAALRKHPAAEFHLLTSPDGRRVLKGFDPRVARVIVYLRKGLAQPLRRRKVRRTIEAQHYDAVYCFNWQPTYHRLLDGIGRHTRLMDRGSWDKLPFAAECLRLVADGAQAKTEWVSLNVRQDSRDAARGMLQRAGVDDTQLVIGLHPSFSGLRKANFRRRENQHSKAWPIEAWGTLARRLTAWGRSSGRPLAVVSDLMPEDQSLGRALVEASGGAVKLFTGPPDFERYKAVLERMDLLVTPDTGPMHIAAAVSTRLVALFAHHGTFCAPFTAPERCTIVRPSGPGEAPQELAAISPDTVYEAVLCQLGIQSSDERHTAAY